jgi:uncharacterized protein (TIGR02391 family)
VSRVLQEESLLFYNVQPEPSGWTLAITESIRHFLDVKTVDDYLHVREELLTPSASAPWPVNPSWYEPTPATWQRRGPVTLATDELHPVIRDACAKRFADGYFAEGVWKAGLALLDFVRTRTGRSELDGDALMGAAFGANAPLLRVAELATETGRNLQRGALFLGQGIVAGIRNPLSHSHVDLTVSEAMERVAAMSLLARWIEASEGIIK